MTKWNHVLEDFLFYKQAEGLAATTLEDYRRRLLHFFQKTNWKTPNQTTIQKFLVEKGNGANYNNYLKYLRQFCKWCVEVGELEKDPTQGIHKKADRGHIRSVELEDVRQTLKQIDLNTYCGRRDYALILLQLDSGIRPLEALQLKVTDVNLRTMTATISAATAKTRESRVVVFSLQTSKAIHRLITSRPKSWKESVPLFASENGSPLTRAAWTRRLKAYAEKAGRELTPYMLRHTAAITFLRQGGDVFALQRMMGHHSLEMTRRYVWLSQSDLQKEHLEASPVAALLPTQQRARRNLRKKEF